MECGAAVWSGGPAICRRSLLRQPVSNVSNVSKQQGHGCDNYA
jgi:hypothetical protein